MNQMDLLTWKDDEVLTCEDWEEEDDEKDLSFMILVDGFEWDSSHKAFEIDWFFKHAFQLVLKRLLKCIFDHLDSSLTAFGHCVSPWSFEE